MKSFDWAFLLFWAGYLSLMVLAGFGILRFLGHLFSLVVAGL